MLDFENIIQSESVKKVIDPIKRKTYPYLITGLCFNILLFGMITILTYNVFKMNKKISLILE